MLIATIIFSVCSFICLLWLNVATVMRMIVIGSVVITTNVLTKAIILPSIFNILVSLFLDAKLAIILITCCAATAFYLHFSPILAKLERFPRNSSQSLKNSSQIPCTFRFLSLPLPSLQLTCGALRMNKGRDDMFKPNQLFLNVVGLFFLPITCRIDTRVIRPLFMRSTPHDVEMPRQNTAVRLPRVF